MKRNLFKALGLTSLAAGIALCATGIPEKQTAYAAEKGGSATASPDGIFTSLSVSLNCGDGMVWATARNDMTLFPATVSVYVELYSSVEYQSSYLKMTQESYSYTSDLDMGETLTATVATGGVQKYWMARIYYRVDNKDWSEKTTSVQLISGAGEAL